MFTYFAVAVAAIGIAALAQFVAAKSPHPRRWNIFDVLVVTLLVCFSALRFEVGTDWSIYFNTFTILRPEVDWATQLALVPQEPGFSVVALFSKWAGWGLPGVLWITSVLTVVPIYAVIKKSTDQTAFAVALYILLAFYVVPFNIVRQGVAIALNVWAYTFMRDRNKTAFIVLNVLAASFHITALIAVVIQIAVARWRIRPRGVVLLIGGALIAAGAVIALPQLQALLASLNPRYGTYLQQAQDDQTGAGLGTYLILAAYIGLLIVCLASNPTDEQRRLITLVAIGVVLLIIGTQSPVLGRMVYYFTIFLVPLVPELLKGKKTTGALVGVGVTAASAVYFAFFVSNFASLVPYQTWVSL